MWIISTACLVPLWLGSSSLPLFCLHRPSNSFPSSFLSKLTSSYLLTGTITQGKGILWSPEHELGIRNTWVPALSLPPSIYVIMGKLINILGPQFLLLKWILWPTFTQQSLAPKKVLIKLLLLVIIIESDYIYMIYMIMALCSIKHKHQVLTKHQTGEWLE